MAVHVEAEEKREIENEAKATKAIVEAEAKAGKDNFQKMMKVVKDYLDGKVVPATETGKFLLEKLRDANAEMMAVQTNITQMEQQLQKLAQRRAELRGVIKEYHANLVETSDEGPKGEKKSKKS